MRHVSDDERRARLAIRHAIAPSSHVDTPEDVTRALTVLHSTDPATVYLSCWARMTTFERSQLDRALYVDRTLVKQLAMRRTLFVFPRDLLAAALGSASARVAAVEQRRIINEVERAGLTRDGKRWLARVRTQILAVLAEHPNGISAIQLRQRVATIAANVKTSVNAPGTMTQVLTYLGARGDIVRAENAAAWQTAKPRWTRMQRWLGESPKPAAAADGNRELVRRWLYAFGPGTENDIVWWTGGTKAAIRQALHELGAVAVSLDSQTPGWLLPNDVDEIARSDPWVALLPALDPTVMGWQSRDFYLGPHREQLFDAQGNAGTTVWVNGRVVGFWIQDAAGVVHVRLLERVPLRVHRRLAAEARRLTSWLQGTRLFAVLGKRA